MSRTRRCGAVAGDAIAHARAHPLASAFAFIPFTTQRRKSEHEAAPAFDHGPVTAIAAHALLDCQLALEGEDEAGKLEVVVNLRLGNDDPDGVRHHGNEEVEQQDRDEDGIHHPEAVQQPGVERRRTADLLVVKVDVAQQHLEASGREEPAQLFPSIALLDRNLGRKEEKIHTKQW
eukprot:gene6494-biopygen5906